MQTPIETPQQQALALENLSAAVHEHRQHIEALFRAQRCLALEVLDGNKAAVDSTNNLYTIEVLASVGEWLFEMFIDNFDHQMEGLE
jgi:hypothetical protein